MISLLVGAAIGGIAMLVMLAFVVMAKGRDPDDLGAKLDPALAKTLGLLEAKAGELRHAGDQKLVHDKLGISIELHPGTGHYDLSIDETMQWSRIPRGSDTGKIIARTWDKILNARAMAKLDERLGPTSPLDVMEESLK